MGRNCGRAQSVSGMVFVLEGEPKKTVVLVPHICEGVRRQPLV